MSIVTTVYNSSPFLDEFVARLVATAETVAANFEIIIVDDGSPDDSLSKAIAHAQRDHRIIVVELARNFGHHAALLTGLSLARGDRVFLIDSDLEEPPELLATFSSSLDQENADVIFGVHDQVVGSLSRRITSGFFWRMFNVLSTTRTAPNICHVRLMNRAYVDALISLGEREVFLGGLYAWPGFRQIPLRVDRQLKRQRTTYSLRKRLVLMVRSIVSFSSRPLHLIFWVGFLIAGISAMIAIYFSALKLIKPSTVLSGFTAVIVSIWFVGGMVMASLGLIGIYIAAMYNEVKGRPRTIIRHLHRSTASKQ